MQCPNCQSPLEKVNLDEIEVDHCPDCGGTFFDENEINRISLKSARYLSRLKKTDSISGQQKFCPRDGERLITLVDEAKPQFVTLLRCEKCHGIFAYADDLVEFKKAQTAKINYYKAWHLPFPQLKTVLIYSVSFFAVAGLIYTSISLQKPLQTRINAKDIISKAEFIKNEDEKTICFTTKKPMMSKITILNSITGEQITYNVSNKNSRLHCKTFSLSELPEKEVYYKITLITQNGNTIEDIFRKTKQ